MSGTWGKKWGRCGIQIDQIFYQVACRTFIKAYRYVMDTIFCHSTALRYHLAPPCVLSHADGDVSELTNPRRPMLSMVDKPFRIFDKPIHLLCTSRKHSYRSKNVIFHTWTKPLPSESVQAVSSSLSVTSPLFTLLMLAPSLNTIERIMLLHEMCGRFSAFRVPHDMRTFLEHDIPIGELEQGGWKPVRTFDGKLTDLWIRHPLLTVERIRRFAQSQAGTYGAKCLARAASFVRDGAASPFEVTMGMLAALPRRMGGDGLPLVGYNQRISLTASARRIARKTVCYGDLLFENPDEGKTVIVECHGAVVHDIHEQALADSTRLAALQSMGYTVLPVTFDQILARSTYHDLIDYMAHELRVHLKPKTAGLLDKEIELRRHLFMDWTKLGAN